MGPDQLNWGTRARWAGRAGVSIHFVSPSHAYPPEARLRRPGEFRRVIEQGLAVPGKQCLVRILERASGVARLGIAAPRGFGGAVRRNRFRRLVREAFRALAPALGPLDLLVSPKRGIGEPDLGAVRGDLERAARRIQGGAASRDPGHTGSTGPAFPTRPTAGLAPPAPPAPAGPDSPAGPPAPGETRTGAGPGRTASEA